MLFDVLKVFKVLTEETINIVMPPGADATAVAAPAADEPAADAISSDATAVATPTATPTAATTDAASLLRTTPGTTITKRLNTIKNIMAVLVEHLDDNKITDKIKELEEQMNTYTANLESFEGKISDQFKESIDEASQKMDTSRKEIETNVADLNRTIAEEHGTLDGVRDALMQQIQSLNESLGDLSTYNTDAIRDAAGQIQDAGIQQSVREILRGGGKSKRKNRKKYSRRL